MTQNPVDLVLRCSVTLFSQAQPRAVGAGAVRTGRRMFCATAARNAASPCSSVAGSVGGLTSTWRPSCARWSRSGTGSEPLQSLCSTWTSAEPSRSSTGAPLMTKVSGVGGARIDAPRQRGCTPADHRLRLSSRFIQFGFTGFGQIIIRKQCEIAVLAKG